MLNATAPSRSKFPSVEGWHAPACRGGLSRVTSNKSRVTNAHRLWRGVARFARRGVGTYHPNPWRRVVYHELRVTLPLSLRRSTINVENVVVRLWQSSTICLRAFARSAFLFTGSPRFARDDKGGESDNYELPLSLRRSTINVENVVVRLRQSSAICLRAFARSAFLFTGSPRFARDDKGE